MTIDNYSRVTLVTDAYATEGVGMGAIGYVIEVYPDDKYEVEFSDNKGITIALILVTAGEIALCNRNDSDAI
ncbi:DUF4926 domain-containing protein [Janthinobacterium sp. SUN100]|uniref:DUF4926 domain-containing protein n=1 Tax=Janthinobacterium sp. SUN100 TaxID=3004101 RepID=UPI0025AFA5F5|nr:DUF4926 domain-containing protein [Janthinobacterium sp. SUN100]MDN2704477.1 DUF4926 domain-containing protein [Janthinobacterium sp. SUN100]